MPRFCLSAARFAVYQYKQAIEHKRRADAKFRAVESVHMARKKKKEETTVELPHLTPEEQADIEVRTSKVNIRILEAKALQLELQNREKIILLDAKAGQLTYIATALGEFSNGMASFVSELRQMPDHLQVACNLTPDQYEGVSNVVDDMLKRLSLVKFHLDSSAEIDERASALQAKTKESAVQRKSASLAKKAKGAK